MRYNLDHSCYARSGAENPVLSDGLRQGLHYSEEDVESSSRFVVFCRFKIDEDGAMIKYTSFVDDDPRTHFIA